MASRFSRPPCLFGIQLAGGPAVVEIEHRGDGIDAQAIDAVAVEPEQRVGDQEIDHFGAAVIVDQRAPVEVAALQRIGVLVERGAVEMAEPVRIVGKMPGHPVEQHAEPFAMAGIDECAKSAGVPNRLVGAYRPVG